MADLHTLARLARSFRPLPGRGAVLLHLAHGVELGGYEATVNVRSALLLASLLGASGAEVHADLGPSHQRQWWRLHYAGQCWSPVPTRACRFGLVVTDSPSRVGCRHDGLWTVEYRMAPPAADDGATVHLPYPMSPMVLEQGGLERIGTLRGGPRPVRILFAGHFERSHYDRPDFHERRFGKRNRWALLEHLRAGGRTVEPASRAELEGMLAGEGGRKGVVVVDAARVPIAPREWLDLVAKADFFFCPPGRIMPPCHNLVEALAVGTIPITNSPEWFWPVLGGGGECLAFDSTADLEGAVDRALAMPAVEVDAMRAAAIAYHDRHLDPRRIARLLAARWREPLRLTILDETLHRVEALPRRGDGPPGGPTESASR